MSLSTGQFTFGIEDLLDDEVVALSPKRIDSRQLRKLSNAHLLRLRNIESVCTDYFQDVKHGRQHFARLDRVEAEMERRSLMTWLSTPCPDCGQRPVVHDIGGELMGSCACTTALNKALQARR